MKESLDDILKKKRIERIGAEEGGGNSLCGLYDLIKKYFDNGFLMVEIGCWTGVSTRLFALHCARIYAVDAWDLLDGYNDYTKKDLAENEINFDRNIEGYGNIIKIKDMSITAAERFDDESLDCVYIDGDHNEDPVYNDIKIWLPKIRKGGIISGHDYPYGGIKSALERHGIVPDDIFNDTSWVKEI